MSDSMMLPSLIIRFVTVKCSFSYILFSPFAILTTIVDLKIVYNSTFLIIDFMLTLLTNDFLIGFDLCVTYLYLTVINDEQ